MKPDLQLHHGGGSIVETLERLLEKARAGEIEAIAVATVEPPAALMTYTAWREDMPHAWARMLAAVASAQHMLLTEGL